MPLLTTASWIHQDKGKVIFHGQTIMATFDQTSMICSQQAAPLDWKFFEHSQWVLIITVYPQEPPLIKQ